MQGDSAATRLPLSGLRIAVTAADLEQLEHRGIAAYSRNLLKALHRAGADLWLITEFDPRVKVPGLRRLPAATQDLLRTAKILDDLCAGHSAPEMSDYRLEQQWPPGLRRIQHIQQRWNGIMQRLAPYLPSLWLRRSYHEGAMPVIFVHEHRDNPYLRHQRLDYLDEVTGILCARRFFGNANALAARGTGGGIKLDLYSFDLLITTCPINLDSDGKTPILQTIHDLIPVEFARHGESPVAFTKRLQASLQQGRLFMSEASRRKYHQYISEHPLNSSATNHERVAIQPPTLQLTPAQLKQSMQTARPEPWSWQPPGQAKKQQKQNARTEQARGLSSLRFLLFNSSVEPRKNVIFLVKAFRESRLAERGYHLCITGTLKQDSYSREVRRLVQNDDSILLTGYIDEPSKVELYSRALALLSPSLVEGFGIPLLDAACIGLPAIASDSASHSEIRDLHDFRQHITLLRTVKTTSWASLISSLADQYEQLDENAIEALVQERLNRYLKYQSTVELEFANSIQQSVRSLVNPLRTSSNS